MPFFKVSSRCIPFIFLIILLASCAIEKHGTLTVLVGNPCTYHCTDGSTVTARFCTLSDKSLEFVKITFDDGSEYTLPRLVAASGVRYTDEFTFQFWVKGSGVTIWKMNEQGSWELFKKGSL